MCDKCYPKLSYIKLCAPFFLNIFAEIQKHGSFIQQEPENVHDDWSFVLVWSNRQNERILLEVGKRRNYSSRNLQFRIVGGFRKVCATQFGHML